MDDRMVQLARLSELGEHLGTHKFLTEVLVSLVVQTGPGGSEEVVTCRPRPEDEGRLWFFAEDGQALAEAGRITDAVVAVKGRLIRGRS